MQLEIQDFSSGEHPLLLDGLVGPLEAILTIPQIHHTRPNHLALLGHPHSLQGGTFNNKVVTTMVGAFRELGIPSLRFNFRGVGRSAGSYDGGIGESQDMIFLAQTLKGPSTQLIFAGFSFGSYVAYRAAAQLDSALLITIAPPIHHYDYQAFSKAPSPWIIIQGQTDDIVPSALITDFSKSITPPISLYLFPDTGHFFHRKLIQLKDQLIQSIRSQAGL